jgi:hypothetical protein
MLVLSPREIDVELLARVAEIGVVRREAELAFGQL